MFVVGNFIEAATWLLDKVLWLYIWAIIIRALISWVNPDPWNPIVQFLDRITEPVLRPIRRRFPWGWGLDLSPMIAILGIYFLQLFVVRTLYEVAARLR